MGQYRRYHFGDDYPPKIVYFKRLFRKFTGMLGFDPWPCQVFFADRISGDCSKS